MDYLQALPTGVFICRQDGHVDFINEHLADSFGLPPDAMLGADWMCVVHLGDRERVASQWGEQASGSDAVMYTSHLLNRDGTFHRYQIHSRRSPRGSSSAPATFIGVAVDVEERLRLAEEKERAAAYRRVCYATDAKGDHGH